MTLDNALVTGHLAETMQGFVFGVVHRLRRVQKYIFPPASTAYHIQIIAIIGGFIFLVAPPWLL